MASTPDRTTIKLAFAALVDTLRSNLVADPPTAQRPFRSVYEGDARGDEFARPFLAVWLAKTKVMSITDDDKVLHVTMHLRVFADVTDSELHAAVLDKAAALEDHLDTLIDTGVIEGAEGFDDRTWVFQHPAATSGARTASVTGSQTFVVKVLRRYNRVPG